MNTNCEFCEKEIERSKETETEFGHQFCSYECLGGFYCDEIPEEEDFIIVNGYNYLDF